MVVEVGAYCCKVCQLNTVPKIYKSTQQVTIVSWRDREHTYVKYVANREINRVEMKLSQALCTSHLYSTVL